jgi:hypothetical protein
MANFSPSMLILCLILAYAKSLTANSEELSPVK